MSNEDAIANLVGLMTTSNFDIIALPDKLKCTECKSVLKNAYQLSCRCRFCRTCIDDVISRGDQFCPGGSQECGATPLSTAAPDYRANKSVLKLIAKCPHTGCLREFPLADMKGHMHACSSKNIDCPFRELGCSQSALQGEEMSAHLLQESCSHSEILIGTVAIISRDMEILKRELLLKDELDRHVENTMKLIIDEHKSMKDDMKLITGENKSIKDEIKSIKDENKLITIEIESIKDENKSMNDEMKSIKFENKSIKDEIKSIKYENKSIKYENKSIKDEIKSIKDDNRLIKIENESIQREKEILSDRVRQLSEKLEQEIDERHQSDKQNGVMVTAVTGVVSSNRDALDTETQPIRNDIRSIANQFNCMKREMESIPVVAGPGQLDDWLIEEDVGKIAWLDLNNVRCSGVFGGGVGSYRYEMESWNDVTRGELYIFLCIWSGPSDPLLQWPFRGEVTITVAHRDKPETCSTQMLQCEIKRPAENQYSYSTVFKFPHATLREAGIDLEHGVRVSCLVVPGVGSDAVSPSVTQLPVSTA